MSKIKMVEEHNKMLVDALFRLENARNNLRIEYSNITQGLSLEEKAKQKVKALENALNEIDSNIRSFREVLARGKQKFHQFDSDRNNKEFLELQEIYQEIICQKEIVDNDNMKLNNEIKDLDVILKQKKIKNKDFEPAESNKALRSKIKNIEEHIGQLDQDLMIRENKKREIQRDISNLQNKMKTETKRNRFISFSLLSPKSSENSSISRTPIHKSEHKKIKPSRTVSAITSPISSSKAPKIGRDKLIAMLSKGIPKASSKEIKNALEEIGIPGQSLARKVVELNRGEFLAKFYASQNNN